MSTIPNSLSARDVSYLVHPETDLETHLAKGPTVVSGVLRK